MDMRSFWRTLDHGSLRDISLVCLADTIVGASFGAITVSGGLRPWVPVTMSVLVFAGGAQFAAAGVVLAGGSPAAAAVAGLVLNARLLPYGFAVADTVGRRWWTRLLGAQLITDETVAFTLRQHERRRRRVTFWTCGLALFGCWNVAVVLGVLAGAVMPPATLGLTPPSPPSCWPWCCPHWPIVAPATRPWPAPSSRSRPPPSCRLACRCCSRWPAWCWRAGPPPPWRTPILRWRCADAPARHRRAGGGNLRFPPGRAGVTAPDASRTACSGCIAVATAVLTALVATAALTQGHGFAGWARPAGVLVGGVLAVRRVPFPVVVIAAAATTAVLRWSGVP
jgi:hypothetical protein